MFRGTQCINCHVSWDTMYKLNKIPAVVSKAIDLSNSLTRFPRNHSEAEFK